jgi:NCS1 family nucleobase:cation symporter-1
MSGHDGDTGTRLALEGSFPVLPSERTWGSWSLFGISVSTAIATWCFLIGGYIAYYLGAIDGVLVMTAGSLVGILLIVGACLPAATRYGTDSITNSRPQLGTRGSYLALLAQYGSVIGWNCLLLIFLGRGAAELLIAMGVFGEGARDVLVTVTGLLACVLVWALLRKGADGMRDVGPIIAVIVSILALAILVMLLVEFGWSSIANAAPLAASDSRLWNVTTGFEIMVAVALSWWPYAGGMVRLVPDARRAIWPVVGGLAVSVGIICTVGLWSGLVLPDSGGDPTTYLVDVGGLALGIPCLLFIILANVGTALVGVYVSAVGLKQIPAVQTHLPWNATTAITLLPVAFVIVVLPGWMFDNIGTFLAFMGVLFAPVCGVQIVDYYLLRRQRLSVRGLYRSTPGSPYYYWHGFNPVAILAIAAGFGTYLYLLDPVNYTSHSPYEYVSASLPAAFIAGALHYVLTRLLVLPRGKGDYRPSPTPEEAAPMPVPAGVVALEEAQNP